MRALLVLLVTVAVAAGRDANPLQPTQQLLDELANSPAIHKYLLEDPSGDPLRLRGSNGRTRTVDPPQPSRQLLDELANSPAMHQYLLEDPGADPFRLRSSHEELGKTTLDFIRENGYMAEQHDVTTADGYILSLHRIPYGRDGPGEGPRTVVHLQHGLLSSSSDWIMQPPDRALAYMLADRGYDVWLGNARGNTYSRAHVNMTSNDPVFWKFTWDQMGQYDAPAMIDYILNETGQEQLFWVGHSMGTTMFWVMMNEHPEYNHKVTLMQAMGPVARVGNMRSPIRILSRFANSIERLLLWFGKHEFLPDDSHWMNIVEKAFCGRDQRKMKVCRNALFAVAGYNSEQFNLTALPVLLENTPAGASTRSVVHYAQQVNSETFVRYDWGWRENLARYGRLAPPEYDLSYVTCPVSLIWSDNDLLADPEDVDWLAKNLPNIIQNYRVPLAAFNHLDFLWAIDGDVLVYNNVIENIRKFERPQVM